MKTLEYDVLYEKLVQLANFIEFKASDKKYSPEYAKALENSAETIRAVLLGKPITVSLALLDKE